MFESLGGFAADAIRRLLRNWQADAVICAGDLPARNKILRERARAGMLRLRVPAHFPARGAAEMCISLPGKVVAVQGPAALVETAGTGRWCNALLQADLALRGPLPGRISPEGPARAGP